MTLTETLTAPNCPRTLFLAQIVALTHSLGERYSLRIYPTVCSGVRAECVHANCSGELRKLTEQNETKPAERCRRLAFGMRPRRCKKIIRHACLVRMCSHAGNTCNMDARMAEESELVYSM